MIKDSLIISWSTAIVEIASEQKAVEEFLETVTKISKIYKENPELLEFTSNKLIAFDKKEQIVDKIFKSKINVFLLNAIKLLIKRNLSAEIIQILKQVEQDLLKTKDVYKGFIYSISPLDEKIVKQIAAKFEKKLHKKIFLVNIIQKELIAGIRVEINGLKYDSSVKGKIIDMKRRIVINRK